MLETARDLLGERVEDAAVVEAVYDFMLERLKGLYAEQGVRPDLFEAVAEIRPASIADFDRRVQAVAAFRALPEAEALAAANKRIRNILRKSGEEAPLIAIDPQLFEGDPERALDNEVSRLADEVEPLIAAADYAGALKALAGLRDQVDTFFDAVMVMADDPAVRANRLALLARLSGLFLKVADISRLQA